MRIAQMEEGQDKIRAQQTIEMDAEKALFESGIITKEQLYERLALLQNKYADLMIAKNKEVADKEKAINEARLQNWVTVYGKMEDIFSSLYETAGRKLKVFFYMQKAAAIAQAIMSSIVAANEAATKPAFTAAQQAINAKIIYLQGMARVAMLSAQAIRGFAEGGMVSGKKGKDNIVARLSDNEYVMQASAVKQYGVGFMEAVNRGLLGLKNFAFPSVPVTRGRGAFAGGGLATAGAAPSGGDTIIANFVDPALFEEFLYSARGQNAQINVIGRRAETVKRMLR